MEIFVEVMIMWISKMKNYLDKYLGIVVICTCTFVGFFALAFTLLGAFGIISIETFQAMAIITILFFMVFGTLSILSLLIFLIG